jgi:hypothetical protein
VILKHEVNWIDAKHALHIPGVSLEQMIERVRKQSLKYVERFGPGAILWTKCGFCEDIVAASHKDVMHFRTETERRTPQKKKKNTNSCETGGYNETARDSQRQPVQRQTKATPQKGKGGGKGKGGQQQVPGRAAMTPQQIQQTQPYQYPQMPAYQQMQQYGQQGNYSQQSGQFYPVQQGGQPQAFHPQGHPQTGGAGFLSPGLALGGSAAYAPSQPELRQLRLEKLACIDRERHNTAPPEKQARQARQAWQPRRRPRATLAASASAADLNDPDRYKGALLFVTGISCNYRDSPYKADGEGELQKTLV